MPGINLFLCPPEQQQGLEKQLSAHAAEEQELFPHIEQTSSQISPEATVCLRFHPNYKVREFTLGDWHCWLENQTADPDKLSLDKLLESALATNLDSAALGALWKEHIFPLRGATFFVAVNPQARKVLFANDALARLPVYRYQDEGRLFLARDLGLLLATDIDKSLSPLYLAVFQIMDHIPGRGTCHKHIDMLEGATLGLYDLDKHSLVLSSDPSLRFPPIDRTGRVSERIKELVDAFDAAACNACAGREPVISLSGGLDSRAVLASFTRQNIPVRAYTCQDAENTASDDVLVAQEIATALGLEHEVLTPPLEAPSLFRKLYHMKHGINYFGVTFYLQFLEAVRAKHPANTAWFTGDGGDRLMPCHYPDKPLRSAREFLDYLYERNAIFPPEETANLYGISIQEIDNYLLGVVEQYPTRSWKMKYKYFCVKEIGGRWNVEGEDRNRHYFGQEALFYDYEFYRLIMAIPDAWKRYNGFYSKFQVALSRRLANIRLANTAIRPAQPGYATIMSIRNWLKGFAILRKLGPQTKQRRTRFLSRDWLSARILALGVSDRAKQILPNPEAWFTREKMDSLSRWQMYQLYTSVAMLNGGDEEAWKA